MNILLYIFYVAAINKLYYKTTHLAFSTIIPNWFKSLTHCKRNAAAIKLYYNKYAEQ